MAFVLNDRIKDTTATTGTGAYTLANSPPAGFVTFATGGLFNLDTTYYAVTDGTNWETGIGTYSTSGPSLHRTQIISSTNSNSAVNWSAGTKTIVCTTPGKESTGMNLIGTYNFLGSSTLTIDNIFTDNLGYRAYKIIGRGITFTFNTSSSGLAMYGINSAGTILSGGWTFASNGIRVNTTGATTAVTTNYGYNGSLGGGGASYLPISSFLFNEGAALSGSDSYSPLSFEMTVFNPRNNFYANSASATSVSSRTPYPNTVFMVRAYFNCAFSLYSYTNPTLQDTYATNSVIRNWRGIYFFDLSGRGREGAIDVYGLSGGRLGG